MPRRHLYREKVRGREDLPVERQELCPAHAHFSTLGRRLHMVAAQDVPDRNLVDVMPQICQGTLEAAIAPRGILLGHTHHQLLHLLRDTRSAKLSSLLAAIKLLRDQSLVPA